MLELSCSQSEGALPAALSCSSQQLLRGELTNRSAGNQGTFPLLCCPLLDCLYLCHNLVR